MIRILGDGTLADAIRMCVETSTPETVVWVAYDTPINTDGTAAVDYVVRETCQELADIPNGAIVILSSQLPVGTCARFETWYPQHRFVVYPENLRVKTAERDFRHQARILLGTRHETIRPYLMNLFHPYTHNIIFMSPESAEMVKHALNTYLAMCITFANDIGRICALIGADPDAVTEGLLTELRVSPKAPLHPGGPYGGGHLARDVKYLLNLNPTPLLEAIYDGRER